MPVTKVTNENVSHEPKKTGCCGGAHAKDEKVQPVQKEIANPRGDRKREHAHHADGGSCCCGAARRASS